MSSAHATLRELVTHLARAQRAFDAGSLDEAERAIADALALDPHNVQAADLRQRIRKDRPPAPRVRAGAPLTAGRAGSPRPVLSRPPEPSRPIVPSGRPPTGRVSPAAWSTFEGRVRARRADRAVSDGQQALARGDVEAAHVALAELDALSPDDPRRTAIADSLPPLEGAGVSTATRPALPAPPLAGRAEAAAPQTPWELPLRDSPLADLPLSIPSRAIDPDITWAAAPRVLPAAPVPTARRSRAKSGLAFTAVAASVLLGFWLFSAGGLDPVAVEPVREQLRTAESRTPEPALDAPGDLPEPLPTFTPPPVYDPEEALAGSTEPVGAPFETVAESAATVSAPEPEVPRPTSGTVTTPPPPALENRVPDTASTAASRPGIARAEPAPSPPASASASPLTPPVESPMRAPDTRRLAGPSGGQPLAGEVTPLPAPPAAAVTTAPAATASPAAAPGATETSAVRGVLDGYADAFSSLNADATQRVWPGVDVRGLRRAFDQLSTQNITFNRCEVNASGETAQAVCTGRATWVPKVGDRSPKSEPRTWRFALGRDDGQWVIDGVQVQR